MTIWMLTLPLKNETHVKYEAPPEFTILKSKRTFSITRDCPPVAKAIDDLSTIDREVLGQEYNLYKILKKENGLNLDYPPFSLAVLGGVVPNNARETSRAMAELLLSLESFYRNEKSQAMFGFDLPPTVHPSDNDLLSKMSCGLILNPAEYFKIALEGMQSRNLAKFLGC